jgi:hypothetical protein
MEEKIINKKSIFSQLNQVDVNDKTAKKGRFTYLSWCFAWGELQKVCPDAIYEVVKFDGIPYLGDPQTGYMVFTKVTAGGITHEMWLPVMDFKNQAKKQADMMDINKAIMRCLVKNIAMFGLGLYIYAGEDIPENESNDDSYSQNVSKSTEGQQTQKADNNRKVTQEEFDIINGLLDDINKDKVELCTKLNIKSLLDLTYVQYISIKAKCEKEIDKLN